MKVGRAQRRADGGDDVAPALRPGWHGGFGGGAGNGFEIQLHAELLGREQELLEHVARLGNSDQEAQRELSLHDHLLDVLQRRPLLRQDAGQGGRDAGAIRAGDGDENAVSGYQTATSLAA